MVVRTVPAAATAVLTAALISCLLIPAIDANTSVSNNNKAVEWQLLSAKNFSSQIHIHPHVLLLVTVPWCGESRSFMRKISLKLAEDQQKYNSLKLMLVHRNVDKVLADSLGAVDEVTFLYYHHAVSYKYQGSLRVPDILSSVDYLLSLVPEELPLRKVNNLEDMEMFLESTDKAILLLETCGWTSKLLAELTASKGLQALQVLRDLNKETNRTQVFGWKQYLKHDVGSEMIIGEDEDRFGGSPWIGEFSATNGTSFSQNEDTQANFGKSCSFTEFKKFESFFSKFIAAARDSYLPPHRQKYAFLSDRFLLSPLSIEVSDVWSLIISYAGCPGCAMKLKEEAYLRHALEMNDQPVIELPVDEKDIGPSLPIDKPSIVLFVDRTSESKETVKQSQEALLAFKEFAQQKQKLQQTDGRSREWTRKKLHTIKSSAGTYRGSRLVISSASDKIKDKLSVVIMKDGKYVTLDNKALGLKGSSFHEILTHVLGQKKHSKLSSLAKETGFQLLSDDIDIKITDAVSHEMGIDIPNSAESSGEVADSNVINSAPVAEVEHFQPASVGPHDDGEHKSSVDLASDHTGLVDIHQSYKDFEVSSVHIDSEIQASLKAGKSESLEHHRDYFNGSFFFSDGNNKLLRSLTNNLKVPSILIVDPISQLHYVFSGETPLKLSSLSIFVDHFLNGSLVPYQRSGCSRKVSEMAHPPFVNLDFQEKDSIPSISTKIFSELVIGTSQSDAPNSTNAWHKDVMVLFSSSWCGFCQRMELVVREAYRALKGSVDLVKCDSESKELCSEDNFKDVISKLPAVYLMDCTSNDCRWILKSMGQREVYPTLLLFPANTKAIIPFDGNMIVTDIIKFLANHGVGSEHLAKQKGTLQMDGSEEHNRDVYRVAFPIEFSPKKNYHDGGAFTDTMSRNQVTLRHGRTEASWKLVVGSFLVASERLDGVNPFSEAKILIVRTNTDLGILGLIINKPISWSNVLESEDSESLREAPLSFGGPVMQEGMPLVSLMRSSLNLQYPQVIPGIYFLDQSATINKIEEIKARNQSASDCWFFWGYSGWSWEQLYDEITDGAWKVQEGSIEDLQWP